jgi:hypothetical protein
MMSCIHLFQRRLIFFIDLHTMKSKAYISLSLSYFCYECNRVKMNILFTAVAGFPNNRWRLSDQRWKWERSEITWRAVKGALMYFVINILYCCIKLTFLNWSFELNATKLSSSNAKVFFLLFIYNFNLITFIPIFFSISPWMGKCFHSNFYFIFNL